MIAVRRRPQPALRLVLVGLLLALAWLLALAATHLPANARPASPRAAPVETQPEGAGPGAMTGPSTGLATMAPELAAAPQVAPQSPPAAQAAPAQRPGVATTAPPDSDDQQLPH